MITLDANVLIAAFNDKDSHHEWALEFFRDTLTSELLISSLTYAEILVAPSRRDMVSQFRRSIDALGFEVMDISAEDAVEIAQVRAETNLRMPDAVVIHTAQTTGSALATTDKQVAKAAVTLGIAVYSPTV